jgi:catechol 2,3-dioxygenase-like lactoylglutathione lyase family enzyme
MEGTQFRYVIKFVTDMNKAVKFYRDTLGLQLRFESPGWSEFATGETTLSPCTRLPTRTRRERSNSGLLSPTWRPSTRT